MNKTESKSIPMTTYSSYYYHSEEYLRLTLRAHLNQWSIPLHKLISEGRNVISFREVTLFEESLPQVLIDYQQHVTNKNNRLLSTLPSQLAISHIHVLVIHHGEAQQDYEDAIDTIHYCGKQFTCSDPSFPTILEQYQSHLLALLHQLYVDIHNSFFHTLFQRVSSPYQCCKTILAMTARKSHSILQLLQNKENELLQQLLQPSLTHDPLS